MKHTAVVYTPTAEGLAASRVEMHPSASPMALVYFDDGPEFRTYDFQGVTPAVLAETFRRLADDIDAAYQRWAERHETVTA